MHYISGCLVSAVSCLVSGVGDQRSVPLSVISYLLFRKFVSVSCFIVFFDFYDFYDFYDFNDFNELTI
jgi:hypothetical protein